MRDAEKKKHSDKSAGHKVGCGEDTDERIPGRNVTNGEKETHTKVKNRM